MSSPNIYYAIGCFLTEKILYVFSSCIVGINICNQLGFMSCVSAALIDVFNTVSFNRDINGGLFGFDYCSV